MELAIAAIVGLMLAVGFTAAGWTVFWLFRFVAVGATDPRTDLDRLGERIGGFLHYVLGQARVIREFGGFVHFFIFWGFLVLQAETIEYMVRAFLPSFRLGMVVGDAAYFGLLFLQDLFGLIVLVAISVAAVRRYVIRPDHVIPSVDAAVILGLIGGLMVTKFIFHGAEIAHASGAETLGWDIAWTPVAAATSYLFGGPFAASDASYLTALAAAMFLAHLAIVVFFANYIPRGKHLHLLGAMPNTSFQVPAAAQTSSYRNRSGSMKMRSGVS